MAELEISFHNAFNDHYTLITRKIIRALSEDARMPISDLAKQLKLSRNVIMDRLPKLERELGIRYTIEFNEAALGLASPHLITVKFSSEPDYGRIAKALERSYIPQLAAKTRGKFDMLIYATAISGSEYARWDRSMRIFLGEYGTEWRASEVVHRQLGFLPLRNELLDRVKLPGNYKAIVKILNENSRTRFQEISKKLGMHFNTVAYNFKKLLKTNYIKRFTLTMNKPGDITMLSTFNKYKMNKDYEKNSMAQRKVLKEDDENSLISRYILTAPLIGAYDFFTLSASDNFEAAYKRDRLANVQIMKTQRPEMAYAEIDRVILGRLPIRSVDTNKEYNTVSWTSEFEDLQGQ
jgi:DNA-binding Lrp family transcriptional regulator